VTEARVYAMLAASWLLGALLITAIHHVPPAEAMQMASLVIVALTGVCMVADWLLGPL
jgi:hypothetical protein